MKKESIKIQFDLPKKSCKNAKNSLEFSHLFLFPSQILLEIIKYHSLIHYPFIMHNFNLLISLITLIQIYHFPISVEGDVGQLVKIPSKIGKGILNKANSFSFGGEYASKIKNGILKKANSFGGALNVKNGILDKANSFGKSLSFRKNNENEEKLEMIFKDLATFQDFVMFTVNSINGRPFLLKKYLNFHSNYHFEILFEKIYKLSENKDEKKKNEELENILNESLDMEHLSMEEAMEWKIQFIDWEEKFRKFPFWFELRQKLIYKYRDENQLVKIYEGLIQSKVEKHEFKYSPEILIHLMKGEQDFDQILWDIKNSSAIIEEQIKLWKEKVEPFFDDFEKITNETVKEKWELLKEMNDAISYDLRFNVNKHLRQTEMNMEIQKERIEKKYQNYLDEMKKMAMKVKVRKAEQKKQSQFYHDMGILSF